jgi:hypothetical protein
MNKFPYQALIINPTPEEQTAQVAWCRSKGKHNKAWIVYHGETKKSGKFDKFFFPDITTRDAFRKEFDIPQPKKPYHFGQ